MPPAPGDRVAQVHGRHPLGGFREAIHEHGGFGEPVERDPAARRARSASAVLGAWRDGGIPWLDPGSATVACDPRRVTNESRTASDRRLQRRSSPRSRGCVEAALQGAGVASKQPSKHGLRLKRSEPCRRTAGLAGRRPAANAAGDPGAHSLDAGPRRAPRVISRERGPAQRRSRVPFRLTGACAPPSSSPWGRGSASRPWSCCRPRRSPRP